MSNINYDYEYIHYMIPKGQSLNPYTQDDATHLMNHINSDAKGTV